MGLLPILATRHMRRPALVLRCIRRCADRIRLITSGTSDKTSSIDAPPNHLGPTRMVTGPPKPRSTNGVGNLAPAKPVPARRVNGGGRADFLAPTLPPVPAPAIAASWCFWVAARAASFVLCRGYNLLWPARTLSCRDVEKILRRRPCGSSASRNR